MTGEIKLWPSASIPTGWVKCNGSTLLIADEPALFSILGTTYGGDGVTTFALPDLEGRFPLGASATSILGEVGGDYETVLDIDNLPSHNHNVKVNTNTDGATTNEGSGNVLGTGPNIYNTQPIEEFEELGGVAQDNVGDNKAFSILNPYIVLHYIIKL